MAIVLVGSYGFETRLVGGVRIAGHRGGFRGIANRVEFYPDLGYVVVVLGNTDGEGAETIAAHVRTQITAAPALSRHRRRHRRTNAADRMAL
jgi:hypothetical protein